MRDDDPKAPTGLPEAKSPTHAPEEAQLDSNIDKAKVCPRCGRTARISSNYLGVRAHCGPCKLHWPITNSPLRPEAPASLPRGVSKQTLVEPDWSKAFDSDLENS